MIVTCPTCNGHCFDSHSKCKMCDGVGLVDLDDICKCGQPAVVHGEGGISLCAADKCVGRN